MRENRPYGSEGGQGQPFPTPVIVLIGQRLMRSSAPKTDPHVEALCCCATLRSDGLRRATPATRGVATTRRSGVKVPRAD
jgi:hypothetical protein